MAATAASKSLDLDIQIQRERLRLAKPAPKAEEIDDTTGAPVGVRAAVGAAVSPKDRLATIRKTFPDAEPHGDDNFIYTDPKTGKRTLYNETGNRAFGISLPTWGDVASIAPEIGEFAGGIVGGATALAAAPFTGGTSVAAVPIGVGTGAVAGRELARKAAQWGLGSEETRPFTEQVADQATTFGVNAIAGPLAEKALQAGKAVVGPVARYVGGKVTNKPTLKAFDDAGVALQAGAVTGNRVVQSLEQGAYSAPLSAGIMQRSFDNTLADVHGVERSIAERLASGARRNPTPQPVQSIEGAGAALKDAAKNAGERFAKTREHIDTTAVNLIGADRPTALTHTTALLNDLEAQLAKAPQSQPELSRAIGEARKMIDDAAQAGQDLPFEVVRKIRSRIGQELERPDVAGWRPGENASMARLYGALKDDLFGAATAAGPRAEQALRVHDRYVRMFRSDAKGTRVPPAETLQKVVDAKTDAQALRYAMEGAQDSTQRLAQLRRAVTPEEWDVISASVFHSLGRAKPGAQGVSLLGETADDFSISTFLTNWSKLQKSGSSKVLFGGPRYAHLEKPINDLVKVVDSLKDSAKMRNTSGTARSINASALVTGTGAALGALAQPDAEGARSGALTAILGGAALTIGGAKLLTSPRFIRWLAGSARAVASNPNSLPQRIARLEGIAKVEPDLREEINQILADHRSGKPPAQR